MTSRQNIVVIRTGLANTASVLAAFSRLGVKATISDRPSDLENAGKVVLPGVGSFGAGVHALTVARLLEPLRERFHTGRPALCICLGMQLLFEQSEESPGVRGLGVVRGAISRFSDGVPVPQLGWNTVRPPQGARFLNAGHAYFANSYRAAESPQGWIAAMSDHGGRFVAAMEHGDVLACQFHPELSGAWGLALIKRWLERAGGA